jgi:environmental stress-induced protein Ves
VVFATLIDGPMRALNLMVRDGAKHRSLQLNSTDAVIADLSVAIAIGTSSILVSDDDQIDLQLLDALLVNEQKTIRVLQGVVVTF